MTENDRYSEDGRMLLCLVLMGLSFVTGFFLGVSLEQQMTIKSLHGRIEQLEAVEQ